MSIRTLSPLIPFAAFFLAASSFPTSAEEVAPSPFDPPQLGSEWERFILPDSDNIGGQPRFLRSQNALLVKANDDWTQFDLETRTFDPNPRPNFDPSASRIVFDGDSPVFWTLPSDPEAVQDYSIHDWTTGEVIGSVAVDSEHPLRSASAYQLDEHGLVALSQTSLITSDPDGNDLRQTPLPQSLYPRSNLVSLTEKWITAKVFLSDASTQELWVWDRSTLDLVGRIPTDKRMISAFGDHLATSDSTDVSIYSLPGLEVTRRLPRPNARPSIIIQVKLGPTGLLAHHYEPANPLYVIRHFDLSDPKQNIPKSSIATPEFAPSVYLSHDAMAFMANGQLYLLAEDTSLPNLDLIAGGSASEGEPAICKIVLSSATDHPVAVDLETFDGTAKADEDYREFRGQLMIPVGETEMEFEVETIADEVLEAHESIGIRILGVTGAKPRIGTAAVILRGNGFNLEVASETFRRSDRKWKSISAFAEGKLLGNSQTLPASGFSTDPTIMTLDGGETDRILSQDAFVDTGSTFTHGETVAWGGLYQLSALNIVTGASITENQTTFGRLVGLTDAEHALIETNESGQSPKLLRQRLSDGEVVAELPLLEGESLSSYNVSAFVALDPLSMSEPSFFIASRFRQVQPADVWIDRLREIDRLTLEVIGTRTWESQTNTSTGPGRVSDHSGDLLFIINPTGLIAFDPVAEEVVWRRDNPSYFTCKASGGMLLAARSRFESGTATGQYLDIFDLRTGYLLQSYSMTDIFAGAYRLGNRAAKIFKVENGWVVAFGGGACRITYRDLMPNTRIVVDQFLDNEESEARISFNEGFSETFETHFFEFIDDFQVTSPGENGILENSRQLQLSSDLQSIPLSSSREVTGSQQIRITIGGPQSGYSYLSLPPYPRRILGSAVFSILPHRNNGIVWEALASPAPTRNSSIQTIAVSGRFLVAGFPNENENTESTTSTVSKVDVYDLTDRQFLYTLSASNLTDATGLGKSIAFSRGRLLVGAPGSGNGTSPHGKVFVFDPASGNKLDEITNPSGATSFGAAIAANDDWIAVGAPATYSASDGMGDIETGSRLNGSVHVYYADDLRKKFSKTQRGEMLGSALALFGDQLAAGSPILTSANDLVPRAGAVRIYDITSATEIAGILPVHPKQDGYFGRSLAGNSIGLSMGPLIAPELNMTGHGVLSSGSDDVVGQGMPGVEDSSVISRFRDVTITGGRSLRLYHDIRERPYASFSHPGVPSMVPACDGSFLYSGDKTVMRTSFLMPPIDDADRNGRIDEFDWLFSGNPDAELPSGVHLKGESSPDGVTFELPHPVGVDASWEFALLESPDLLTWHRILTWSPDTESWIDMDGAALPKSEGGNTSLFSSTRENTCFFRYELLSGN